MASLPPLPPGFELESEPSPPDPFRLARDAGFRITNGYRTQGDQSRLRRAGYNPAPNSDHLRGDAMDLVHPRMSPSEQVAWARQNIPGVRPVYHDGHLHVSVPGWGAAPGTPGTANSGLPPLPDGFELEQRGSLAGTDWDAPQAPVAPAEAAPRPVLPAWTPEAANVGAAPVRALPAPPQLPARSPVPVIPEGSTVGDVAVPGANAGEFAAVTPDPERMRQALGALESAFDRGAGRDQLVAIANRYGVADARLMGQLDAALAWREGNADSLEGTATFLPREVARVGQQAPRPQAELRAHDPDIAETIGSGVRSVLEPVVGRYSAANAGRNTDDFLSQLTPVGAIDAANEFEEARQRALIEGRALDATGNALGRDANMLMALPIIGAGRGAGRAAAARAIEHIGQAAARRGVRDVASLTDAQLSAFVQRHADALPDDVRTFLRESGDLSEDHIAALRADARPGMVQRGVAAIRRGLGRGERRADDAGQAVEEAASPPTGRAVDRIDVRDLPPLPPGFRLEEPLGRVYPLGEQPAPETLADVARTIRPGDVTPIPANRIESEAEALRANPGTIRDVEAPDERQFQRSRRLRTWRGGTINYRGPVDAETFIRMNGGLRESAAGRGDLAHIGIVDNAPRHGNGQERNLGPILNPDGMTLDEAGEMLAEAGYFAERPRIDDVIDMLRESRAGNRLFHPDDFAEVEEIEAAMRSRWSVEGAEAQGAPLGSRVGEPVGLDDLAANEPPVTAYEDLPRVGGTVGNINLANIESAQDIRRLLQNVEDRFGGFHAARRGTITQAETRALAGELGMTATDLLRRRRGQALNAEQALAARQLLAKSSDEVIRLAERATGSAASDESRSAFSEALLRHAAIHEQVTGATAEAGRALSAFRIAARSRAVSNRIHEAAIDGMGGQGRLEDIANGILELQRQGVGPGQTNRFAVQAVRPRLRDKLVELWYNSLLSGPQTHVVNTLSNAMTQALQIPEQVVASAIGQGRRAIRAARGLDDDFDRVLGSELGPRVVGLMQGAREGVGAFGRTLRTGEVPDFVTKVEARSQRAISGLKGEVVRIPSRLLAAEDEFFKATARRMELNGLAVRQAAREGLRGQEARDRIADLAVNPTDEMLERALDSARYLTFQRPLQGLPMDVSRFTQRQPWMKLFLPFIRTPTNIFKFAVERSPFAPVLREVRENFKAGGERRALATARMALGTGLGMTIAQLAADGTITGGAPRNRAERDMLMADGWQPYSIRIGDTYYSYQRLDPLAMTLGTAANMADAWRGASEGDMHRMGAALITSVIGNLSDKTWLSGVSDLMGALDDPERNLSSFTSRLAGSVAVPTGVAQVTRWMDPTLRETRGEGLADSALRRIQSRLPGLSDDLPARRDVFGREIVGGGGLGPDLVSPIWTSQARNDPVIAELRDAGTTIGRPSRTIGGQRLTAEQYAEYQTLAGRYLRADLEDARARPDWRGMSAAERGMEVSRITRRSRADARTDMGLGRERGAGQGLPSVPPLPPGFVLEGN